MLPSFEAIEAGAIAAITTLVKSCLVIQITVFRGIWVVSDRGKLELNCAIMAGKNHPTCRGNGRITL